MTPAPARAHPSSSSEQRLCRAKASTRCCVSAARCALRPAHLTRLPSRTNDGDNGGELHVARRRRRGAAGEEPAIDAVPLYDVRRPKVGRTPKMDPIRRKILKAGAAATAMAAAPRVL